MVDLDDLSVYGYELERLLKIKHQCDEICAWFLNEKGSIRMCAKDVCMSKSLVHKYIHTYIKKYYDEEYQQILQILKYNSRYRKKPHRFWSGRPF